MKVQTQNGSKGAPGTVTPSRCQVGGEGRQMKHMEQLDHQAGEEADAGCYNITWDSHPQGGEEADAVCWIIWNTHSVELMRRQCKLLDH